MGNLPIWRSMDGLLAKLTITWRLFAKQDFIDSPGSQPAGVGITFRRLSWRGHEFLDTVRNPEIWRETKIGIAKIGGASAEFVWEIAKGYVKHLAKEKLGIDVS